MDPATKRITFDALGHFERLVKPRLVQAVKTQTLDDYVASRRIEKGQKKGSTISPASVNKELRHLRAVLRIAHEWGYLPTVPKVRMMKEPKKLITYVTPEDFAKIYSTCDAARFPKGLPYSPCDWWRAFLVFAYMTGWRVGEPLAVRREDVDLEAGTAITRHEDNKGDRTEVAPLHSVV